MKTLRIGLGLTVALVWAGSGSLAAPAPWTQDPAPDDAAIPEAPAPDEVAPDEAAPWDGTFAAGMEEVRRLAAEDQVAEALALTDRLLVPGRLARWRNSLERRTRGWSERLLARPLAWLGLETLAGGDRGEVHYARGLLHHRQGAVLGADSDLELARVLAGPGTTRADATYALGTLDLLHGEELRARIPEVSGSRPTPPGGPGPGGPVPPGGIEEPDPLPMARAAYRAAREHLVQRLRLDWRDGDTRANVELVQRRLRELDEIEERRREQQPPPEGQQQEPSEGGDPGDREGQQDPQDPQGQEQPADPGDPEQETEQDPSQDESDDPEPGSSDELLTEEEIKRLLELLREYQKEGEELDKSLRGFRRERVKKDW